MRGERARVAALIAVALALLGAAPALGAFPGSPPQDPPGAYPDSQESPRANTPNDPDYDNCEVDGGENNCASYWNEQFGLFGFQPDSAHLAGLLPLTYPDCSQLDAQGRDANVKAEGGNQAFACAQISGVRADSAWKFSTGDPSEVVSILDTGIRWQSSELIDKVHLNTAELPVPDTSGPPLRAGVACSGYTGTGHGGYDKNGDGVVNVADYACDRNVTKDGGDDEADSVLDASDLIAAYSNGDDADRNGYVDDIAGWDFFDDDNDPFDASSCCSAGGHGTGRASEAVRSTDDAQGKAGLCPKCQLMPLRVWDTFVVDTNLYAMGVVYAANNGAGVVEGAVGGLLNSSFARRAFRYADSKGVSLMLVSSDINSANHNYPTNYNEAMYVAGSLPDTAPADNCELGGIPGAPSGSVPGCNAFLEFIKGLPPPFALNPSSQPPTTSFFRNSNLTQYGGKADVVMVGSTGSENTGQAAGAAGLVRSYGRQRFPANPLTGREVRQILTMSAEDVLPANTGSIGQPDKAGPGWDPHFGYGRVNLAGAMRMIQAGQIPPEVQIDSPDWFAPIDVDKVGGGGVPVRGTVSARHFPAGDLEWRLDYACGQDAPDDSFQQLTDWTSGEVNGSVGTLSKALLDQLADSCDGSVKNDAGRPAGNPTQGATPWPANPYPEPDPERHAFQIRLTARQKSVPENMGRYRKTLHAYRDDGTLPGWPRPIGPDENAADHVTGSGGEAAPRLFDLDGDNRLDVVLPTSSGEIRVLDRRGDPLPSWNHGEPVKTRPYAVADNHPGAGLPGGGPLEPPRTPAIGDITGDGQPEVVATAGEHVYAWHRDGTPVAGFPARLKPELSAPCKPGAPSPCFHPADRLRTSERHIKRGFFGSPALADLNGDGALDIVTGSLDQHVYAFDGQGRDMPGFPALLDKDRKPNEPADDSGAEIVASPAIADLDGDKKPEIVLATNEVDGSQQPPDSFDPENFLSLFVQNATGRMFTYALHGDGTPVAGWPVASGVLQGDILPLVLPSEDAAVVDVDKDGNDEVSITAGTGDGKLVDGDGSTLRAYDNTPGPDAGVFDKSPVLNLADYPAIGRFTDAEGPSLVKGGLSLAGAANLLAVNQNLPFNHVVQALDVSTGSVAPFRPGYPTATDDYQLLSQPVIAKVGGSSRQALVGTGLYQLHAYGQLGREPPGWPKFTGGWIFATPSVGDVDGDGKLDVVTVTREGWSFVWKTDVPSCEQDGATTNNEWWTFHHDEHGSANYGHDGRPPGTPVGLSGTRKGASAALAWSAPGDDLLCGKADRARIVAADHPVEGPRDGTVLDDFEAGNSGEAVSRTVGLPADARSGRGWHLAVVYRDEAGNWGHPADLAVDSLQSASRRLPCLPRRLAASGRRIGPARLGRSLRALRRRYRAVRRTRRGTRFCVTGGGRFVVSARRNRIDLIATTARRHRTRRTAPGRRVRRGRVAGAHRIGRGLFVGRRYGGGRVVYGVRGKRVRFLAVVTKRQADHPRTLRRRLRRLGFR